MREVLPTHMAPRRVHVLSELAAQLEREVRPQGPHGHAGAGAVTAVRAADARRAVVELLADQLTARGLDGDALPDDFDLLGEELIDSFGLLELITALEERFPVSSSTSRTWTTRT